MHGVLSVPPTLLSALRPDADPGSAVQTSVSLPDAGRLDFEELVEARHFAQEFVVDHQVSVMAFNDAGGTGWFRHASDSTIEPPSEERPVRHITTGLTCWESLLENRRRLRIDGSALAQYQARIASLNEFAELALSHPKQWKSENSGFMYCRARSFGVITRYGRTAAERVSTNARNLLDQLWTSQPEGALVGAYGIAEVSTPPPEKDKQQTYPINAYHTYWATTSLKRASEFGWSSESNNKRLAAGADRLRLIAGEQMALLAAGSSFADPQQLAWSISGIVYLAKTTDLSQGGQTYHLVRQGLRQFFSQQDSRGDWSRGTPLFNYQGGSGNAYCYIFETLGEMLAVATDPTVPAHAQFADMLAPYAAQLVRLLHHAGDTALGLPEGGRGWVSGHSPNAESPEAWATASIFRYAHRLRVLLGNWTNQSARSDLGARKPTKGELALAQRGGTWDLGLGTAGTQLATNFALPTLATISKPLPLESHFTEDPDDEIIAEGAGRSAVLYGPPGTGKTTLVEAVAGQMDWPFVEITPDMFLNQGLDMVSARADQVFRRMMELDRCVVLIDEIDELVQKRGQDAQQLARFFTTTMLPRLSKLWAAGRVLFFANTNGIKDVDPAIKRSGRFDAAIFVLPPGPEAKRKVLLDAHHLDVPAEIWEKAAQAIEGKLQDGDRELGWLALIRHDQLPSLAKAIERAAEGKGITSSTVKAAVESLKNDLITNDWWAQAQALNGNAEPDTMVADLKKNQRREQRLVPVVNYDGADLPGAIKIAAAGTYWRIDGTPPDDLDTHNFDGLTLLPSGKLKAPAPRDEPTPAV